MPGAERSRTPPPPAGPSTRGSGLNVLRLGDHEGPGRMPERRDPHERSATPLSPAEGQGLPPSRGSSNMSFLPDLAGPAGDPGVRRQQLLAQREEERRRELLNMGYVISSTGNPVKPQSHARQLQRKRAKVRPILVAKLKAALAEVAEDWDVDALRDALSYVQKEEVMRDLATARSALVLQAVEPPLQPDAEESQDAGEAVPVFAVPL
mmetsp:Transcript_2353/g.7146  ORF Transcript_2353/g.7146 Transcript_2353/m.7146 type:complete len:208 (+) Transcript_2353:1-624(+)